MKNKALNLLFGFCLALGHSVSAALFTSDASIAADDTNYDNEDIFVIGCTVTIDGSHSFSDLFVLENGAVTHSPATNGQAIGLELTISNTVFVEAGSRIDADGQGNAPGSGPGAGLSGTATSPFGLGYTSGGGGGYGGEGGASVGGIEGGGGYGALPAPTNPGSGGGAGFGPGGAGGGIVHLTVGSALLVDGEITANGGPGGAVASGGGSGGAIWISAPWASGFGSILANGGAGEAAEGGGGGGGRIALFFSTNSFAGTVAAHGGMGAIAGGAGTVAFASANSSPDLILVDNGGLSGSNTPLSVPPQSSLVISGGAIGYFSTALGAISNLTIGSNSWLIAAPGMSLLKLTASGNAKIENDGGINATGAGGLQGLGDGAASGGGGGHGGRGGNGLSAAGGVNYDSYNAPEEAGSPGGRGNGIVAHGNGGAGGGAIKLNIAGTLTLNGVITADGEAGTGDESGGGSGGSVWLTTQGLAGSGVISANGGGALSSKAGGGGGGRIAVIASSNVFTGQFAAHGGPGFVGGGAGTIYLTTNNVGTAQLVLDNGGIRGTNTPIGLSTEGNCDLTVTNGALAAITEETTVQNLLIASNSAAECSSPTTQLFVKGIAVVEAGGQIRADGAGYSGQVGEGGGITLVSNGITSGGGGGNGGDGGNSALGAQGGNAEANPGESDFFPGGGGGAQGGAGGGSLRLMVTGGLTLNGVMSANGETGLASGSGGGAGGSIFISAASLGGSGVISANGGAGALPNGGGGGGGVIELAIPASEFSGGVTAYGGPGATGGGAGIVVETFAQSVSQVFIDNGGRAGTNTPFSGFAGNFNLSILGGAVAVGANEAPEGRAMNLLVGSNSFLTYGGELPFNWSFSSNITIEPTGGIVVDGMGSPAGMGLGAGSFQSGAAGAGGGGYGGNGGAGQGGSAGGGFYGFSSQPDALGSGGAIAKGMPAGGSQGGGAIELTAGGTLFVGGSISANGINGLSAGAGGGSGGSIYLAARELAGNGSITANGGAGQLPAGGGGGGGRIFLSLVTNAFAGVLSAHGGAGFVPGGAGTILFPAAQPAPWRLVVDGGGLAGGYTAFQSLDVENADLIIRGGSVVLLPSTAESIALASLFVDSNSFILQTNQSRAVIILQSGPVYMEVSGNVTVQPGGGIVLDGAGSSTFAQGAGGGTDSPFGYLTSGGGGHGGYGGSGQGGALGGIPYDTVEEPASQGGNGGSGGGNGGGALNLRATGALQIDGVISANGAAASTEAGGGGAGGSLYLTATSIAGAGSITANGGAGDWPDSGGGSGGRISLNYQSNSFTGELSAAGGSGYQAGGAGTIYLNPSLPFVLLAGGASYPRQVIVDNGGQSGANTLLGQIKLGIPENQIAESYDLIVAGGAHVNPTANWSLRSLMVQSNSLISQSTNSVNINVSGDATVQSNAAISADGLGWDGDTGPDPGATAANDTSSGGGYGGRGGASEGGAAGGGTNGSIQMPVGWGSGGGVLVGKMVQLSQGGGAVKLTAGGMLTIEGTISAHGADGIFPGAGGGAGGSVWLTAGELTGAGTVSANGGAGQGGAGGGGGGGRVALYAPTNEFAGAITASGGAGFAAGQNGTIYVSGNLPLVSLPAAPEAAPLSVAQPAETSLVILTWPGVTGAFYQAQATIDLLHWQPIGGILAGHDGRINLWLSTTQERNRYFRIVPAN